MLPESLATSRAVPPIVVGIAAAIKAARDAITAYEGLRIIASEMSGEPGSIRSMIAPSDRGQALTADQISAMPTSELTQSITIDDPFDETRVSSLLSGEEMSNLFLNAAREEEAGRLALSELERRFEAGDADEQQAIIDQMQARQQVTENDEQARENEMRTNAFNRTTRNAFEALGDLGAAFFGRPRRSSDSARVSMERHEYDYCCLSPVRLFAEVSEAGTQGGTYLQAMFHALSQMLEKASEATPDREGNILVFSDSAGLLPSGVADFGGIQEALTLTHGGDNGQDNNRFFYTYGNWVDSPWMRRGIGLIRRLVRTVRSANVTEILRLTTGETPPQFFVRLLENLNYTQLANVLREFIITDMDLDAGVDPINSDPTQGLFFTVQPAPTE